MPFFAHPYMRRLQDQEAVSLVRKPYLMGDLLQVTYFRGFVLSFFLGLLGSLLLQAPRRLPLHLPQAQVFLIWDWVEHVPVCWCNALTLNTFARTFSNYWLIFFNLSFSHVSGPASCVINRVSSKPSRCAPSAGTGSTDCAFQCSNMVYSF